MPRLVSIHPIKGRRQWQRLEFDTGLTLDVPHSMLATWHLRCDAVLSDEQLAMLQREATYQRARELALGYIGYKPRTEQQLRQYLQQKGFDSAVIQSVIEFLYHYHYLDDQEYARLFVSSYLQRKPSGHYRLRQELRRRGIADSIIDSVLDPIVQDAIQLDLARQAAERKLRTLRSRPVPKQRRALEQFLQRRGFPWEIIRRVVDEMFESLQ